jgi:hypothetical protein
MNLFINRIDFLLRQYIIYMFFFFFKKENALIKRVTNLYLKIFLI